MQKILLILDLDETLIHSTLKTYDKNWDFEVSDYKTYIRPFLKKFLDIIRKNFTVAVWSSSSDYFVEKILN